jgi:predicted  nucleic acid-binding Zn-ribbon protein
MSLIMAHPHTVALSEVLKQNAKLKAELDNKDEFIKKLIISVVEEEDKNEKLYNQLQVLQDHVEWLEHELQELRDLVEWLEHELQEHVHRIDFLYCSACFGLGTFALVLLFKLVK